MKSPLVSAIITSYKRPVEIVGKAIESVKNQTYSNVEILLVDDNKDDSEDSRLLKSFIIEKFPDVIYVKQDGNQGACAARNLGVKCSKGEYVAFLDDDDEWLPDKIKAQVERFINSGGNDYALVYGPGIIRDYRYDPVQEYAYYNNDTIYEDLDFRSLLNKDCIGSTSVPLIKKDVLVELGGFAVGLPARQDYEMWLRIAKNHKISGINEMLFVHNYHKGEQISKNPKKSYAGYSYIYREFRDDYRRDIAAHRNIYNTIYRTAIGARARGRVFIMIKYCFIALFDEIRKRVRRK